MSIDTFDEKWRFRSREITVIKNLLHSNSDFFIYGLPGIGKTSIVQDTLKNEGLHYFKINCIENNQKAKLLKEISRGIARIFSLDVKESHTFSSFIENLADVVEQLRVLKKFDWEDKAVYLLLDNCQKLELSSKNYSSLLRIKKALRINLNTIFVGLTMLEEITIGNYEFSTIPKIILPNPSTELLTYVFWKFLSEQSSNIKHENFHKGFNALRDELTKDVIQSFSHLTANISSLLNILSQLWNKFLELSFDSEEIFSTATHYKKISLKSCDEYKNLKKALLTNPYTFASDKLVSELSLTRKKREQQLLLDNAVAESLLNTKVHCLSKIPAIILVACYLGNRNPESTDKKLLKDYKKKNKRKVKEKEGKGEQSTVLFKNKTVSTDRLIAITQSLMSILMPDLLEENEAYDQSFLFYTHIGMLIKERLINKMNTKYEDISKNKYICNVDLNVIEFIANKYNFKLSEFMYED